MQICVSCLSEEIKQKLLHDLVSMLRLLLISLICIQDLFSPHCCHGIQSSSAGLKTKGLRKYPGWEDGRRREMRAVCRPRRACFWISDQKLQRRPLPNPGLPNICCHIILNYLFVDPSECMYQSFFPPSQVHLKEFAYVHTGLGILRKMKLFNQQQQNDLLVCAFPACSKWIQMENTHIQLPAALILTAGSDISAIDMAEMQLLF